MNPLQKTIRTFLGIDLPLTVKKALGDTQVRFKALKLHASWVKPENIHLTLKFLGDVSPQQISLVKEELLQALEPVFPFQASLGPTGVFPNINRPRTLWVGLEDPEGRLSDLHQRVEETLQNLGFPGEKRPFSPHLTLARIKSPKNKGLLRDSLESLPKPPLLKFDISSVKLYKSELTPKGSIYTVLEELKLGPASD